MRVVIQRVTKASVAIDGAEHSSIGEGLLVLAGFEESDQADDLKWMAAKIIQLRIFDDASGMMNLSVKDKAAELMVVSQFTLHALTRKGNRPSFIQAAKPDVAIPLYEAFIYQLSDGLGQPVKSGRFGADMQISLVNDGPVTIIIDSKNKA